MAVGLFVSVREGSTTGVPQGSCSLRPEGILVPDLPCGAITARSQIPGSQALRRQHSGAGRATGARAVLAELPLHFSLRWPHWALAGCCLWPQPSLVLYEHLHLVDEVPGNPQDILGVMMLSPFIEELDNIGEVHVVVTDNLTVGLHQSQGNEQDKVLR